MKKKIVLSLTALALSTNILLANAYTDAIAFNDSERIEELNSGFEQININDIDDTTSLTPLQYAAIHKPEMIHILLNNYDLNLLKTTDSYNSNVIQLLVKNINSPSNSTFIKYTIETLFFALNQPSIDWATLLGSGTNNDVVKHIIDNNIFEILYFLKSNNIQINNDYYINYAINNNPLMAFYLYDSNNRNLYIKAIEKLILSNSYDDMELLLSDSKIKPYLEETLSFIKKYNKFELLELLKIKISSSKFKKLESLIELKLKKEFKNSEYFSKIKKLKTDIMNLELKETNYIQQLQLKDSQLEIQKLKIETAYQRKIEYLKNKLFKDKMNTIHKLDEVKAREISKIRKEINDSHALDLKALKLSNDNLLSSKITKISNLKDELNELNKLFFRTKDKYKKIVDNLNISLNEKETFIEQLKKTIEEASLYKYVSGILLFLLTLTLTILGIKFNTNIKKYIKKKEN